MTEALAAHISETSMARKDLIKYCIGNGLDIGHGGDKICPSAIAMDMDTPYTKLGTDPVQLAGDARDLYWFRDNVLDYIYSSHLLEDFDDTTKVLREWFRVLKKKGKLILCLPDEQVYSAHCIKTGQGHNPGHKHKDFSVDFVLDKIPKEIKYNILFRSGIVNTYSFYLVLEKR